MKNESSSRQPPSALVRDNRGNLQWIGEDHVGTLLLVLETLERHRVAGNDVLRVLDPLVQGLVAPLDPGRLQCRRIAVEALQSSGFSIPQIGETRTRHIAVRFQGMAGRTGSE